MTSMGIFQNFRRPVVSVLLLVGLMAATACVPTGATVPDKARFSPTAEEQAEMTALGHANAIAKLCRSGINLNTVASRKALEPIVERAQAAGVRVQYEPATLLGLSKAEAQQIGLAYRTKRGIVPSQPETWCAAGRYELRNKTRVGKFLIDVSKLGN
jgi:hypothetical protein